MLLNQFRAVVQRGRREERGAAMASVLGLILVGGILSALIVSSMVATFSQTTGTRAGVQAQAAAEAGLAAAYAGLQTPGSCATNGAIYTSPSAPHFRATVWYGASIGCPTGSGTVTVISTGWADNPGVAGNTSGDVAYLEATYSVAATNASGAAVYVYNGGQVNAFTVTVPTSNVSGDIQIPQGNFSCTTASTINGSVIVAAGSVNLTNTCKVTGSIRAYGSVSLTSSAQVLGDVTSSNGSVSMANSTTYIKGNVSANGTFSSQGTVDGSVEATGAATLQAGGVVKGSIASGGNVEIRGTVNGNVTGTGTGSIPASSGRVNGSMTVGGSWTGNLEGVVGGDLQAAGTGTMTFVPGSKKVGGNLKLGGALSTWGYQWNVPSASATDSEKAAYYIKQNGWVGGTISFGITGLGSPVAPTAKAAPTVPAWVDWTYTNDDFTSAGFVNEIMWPAGQCQVDNYSGTNPASSLYNTWQQVLNATTPTIVNTLNCSNGINFSSSAAVTINFKTDVAFIGRGFTLEKMTLNSNDSTAHKVYFLVPDGAPATAGSQCSNGARNISTNSTTIVNSPISVMFYTPCSISVNNETKIRGQFYSGSLSMSANDGLAYVATGIPGTNLDGVSGSNSTGTIGAAVTVRNRSNNGE